MWRSPGKNSLLFGMNQAYNPRQKELTVQLSDHIVMSPFAAKRLSILLNNVTRDHETRFGTLNVETHRPESLVSQARRARVHFGGLCEIDATKK